MANDFSADSNCVSVYRFENGALSTDSKGSNILTSVNTPIADTTNYREGSASTLLAEASDQYYERTNVNLSTGFPFKNDDTTLVMTCCFWHRTSFVEGYDEYRTYPIFSKGTNINSYEGPALFIDYNGRVWFDWAGQTWSPVEYHSPVWNEGEWDPAYYTDITLNTASWYHMSLSVDANAKEIHLRIYDVTGDTVIDCPTNYEYYYNTITLAGELIANSNAFRIGAQSDFDGSDFYNTSANGNIDEFVMFNRILSSSDMDKVRQGTYNYDTDDSDKEADRRQQVTINEEATAEISDTSEGSRAITVSDSIKETDVSTTYLEVIREISVSQTISIIDSAAMPPAQLTPDTDSITIGTSATCSIRNFEEIDISINRYESVRIIDGTTVYSNLFYPGPGDGLQVAVTPGTYRLANTIYTLYSIMTVTGLGEVAAIINLNPAHATYFRYDIITADSDGHVNYTAGTAAAIPVMPATPSDELLLNYVLVYPNMVRVVNYDIGRTYVTPYPSSIEVTTQYDNPMPGHSGTTPSIYNRILQQYVYVKVYDQYNNLIRGDYTSRIEVLLGSGTFDEYSKSTSNYHTMTYIYYRPVGTEPPGYDMMAATIFCQLDSTESGSALIIEALEYSV